ncbi:hypothetical protein Cni_G13125 [Canna indica]|uniref:Uncharacterized protein n=1 Tax=Canna indica TaxID=4628 RepID=A0AAQ3K9C6_9LILI|nr:hypothetical protein Cni_G13125 [Canna indica]
MDASAFDASPTSDPAAKNGAAIDASWIVEVKASEYYTEVARIREILERIELARKARKVGKE